MPILQAITQGNMFIQFHNIPEVGYTSTIPMGAFRKNKFVYDLHRMCYMLDETLGLEIQKYALVNTYSINNNYMC